MAFAIASTWVKVDLPGNGATDRMTWAQGSWA